MATRIEYPMKFTGSGGEYFRIWIVNIALTLATLGIYSAWAKVRTKRWFYGHTFLDRQPFAYHATPTQILRGRLIAMGFVMVYVVASEFIPSIALVLLIVLYLATPWIIVQSLKFNARVSSYRGIRFNFVGSLRDSVMNFLVWPLLIVATMGLAMPYVVYRQTNFFANNYEYGQTRNRFMATPGPFWKAYGIALLIIIVPALSMGYGMFEASKATVDPASAEFTQFDQQMLVFGMIGFYLAALFAAAYIKVRIGNTVYNHSQFNEVYFVSDQRVRDVAWIYVSNLILIGLTLGLFVPWAKVRLAKYRANHLTVETHQSLATFAAGNKETVGTSGEELADALDMDFGI